jgi:hypothetical protein
MDNSKKDEDQKSSFSKVANNILGCVALIALGIGINKYFIDNRLDAEKLGLEKQNSAL